MLNYLGGVAIALLTLSLSYGIWVVGNALLRTISYWRWILTYHKYRYIPVKDANVKSFMYVWSIMLDYRPHAHVRFADLGKSYWRDIGDWVLYDAAGRFSTKGRFSTQGRYTNGVMHIPADTPVPCTQPDSVGVPIGSESPAKPTIH